MILTTQTVAAVKSKPKLYKLDTLVDAEVYITSATAADVLAAKLVATKSPEEQEQRGFEFIASLIVDEQGNSAMTAEALRSLPVAAQKELFALAMAHNGLAEEAAEAIAKN